ncbi:MAG: hypothetical protein WD208_07235 [Dehalococcoidia bacterium]
MNHRHIYRFYMLEDFAMRTKKPRSRHVSSMNRLEVPDATASNQVWSMDFMNDELFDGELDVPGSQPYLFHTCIATFLLLVPGGTRRGILVDPRRSAAGAGSVVGCWGASRTK